MTTARVALITIAMVFQVTAAIAQSGDSSSVPARQDAARRFSFISNAGLYFPLKGIVEFGAVAHHSPRDGVGASWFVAVDDNGLYTGPALRWRRSLGPTRSIDVALGTSIVDNRWIRPGSALGLVKYNLSSNFGIAARPELVLYEAGYPPVTSTKVRLYLGAELGGKPGKVLGSGVVIAIVVLAAAVVASGGILD